MERALELEQENLDSNDLGDVIHNVSDMCSLLLSDIQ